MFLRLDICSINFFSKKEENIFVKTDAFLNTNGNRRKGYPIRYQLIFFKILHYFIYELFSYVEIQFLSYIYCIFCQILDCLRKYYGLALSLLLNFSNEKVVFENPTQL